MFAAQLALNALALGAAYALVALGFVLVLNATTAVNFGHGDTVNREVFPSRHSLHGWKAWPH